MPGRRTPQEAPSLGAGALGALGDVVVAMAAAGGEFQGAGELVKGCAACGDPKAGRAPMGARQRVQYSCVSLQGGLDVVDSERRTGAAAAGSAQGRQLGLIANTVGAVSMAIVEMPDLRRDGRSSQR